jgi:DNA-binding transcriptional LysR family regulator
VPQTTDFNDIRYFVKVATTGSFTAAARELGAPKSTVSRRVAQLEERLGARLLERTTRKLRLTEVGAAYYERSKRAVRDLEEAERAVGEAQESPRGTLRLTAPFGADRAILGPVIGDYLREHQEVRIEAEMSDRYVDLIEEGFDVALRAGRLDDSSLFARKLLSTGSVVLAAPSYIERRGAPQHPSELAEHDCLVFPRARLDATWLLTRGSERLEIPVHARVATNSIDLMRQLLLDGVGLALLPTFRNQDDLECGSVVRVLDEWVGPTGTIAAVFPSRRYLTPKVRTFVDAVETRTRAEGFGQLFDE